VQSGERGAPGDDSLPDENLAVLHLVLVWFGALAHIDQADAQPGAALCQSQQLDQARRVPAEGRVVGHEPASEHRIEAGVEVDRDRDVARVQDRQHAAEAAAMIGGQQFKKLDDPSLGKPVRPTGPAVLGRLPAHHQPQGGLVR
jgi:hypothetical protein